MDVISTLNLAELTINTTAENGSDWCEIEDAKSQWKKFAIVFSLEFILALVTLIINFLFLCIIRKVQVMPANVRWLLAHLSCNLMWFAAGTIYKVVTFLSVSDPCSLRMNAFECRLLEYPFTLPLNATFYSLLGICVERLFSTVRITNRDHGNSSPIMALLFILIIWVATFFNSFYSLPYIDRTRMVPVCEASLSLDPHTAPNAIAVNMVLEVVAMSAMLAVSIYENYVAKNIAINRVKYTLSSRFQITQNVEVNALMLPSMVLHVVCYLPNLIFYILVFYNIPMTMTTKWMVIHLSYLWRLIYAICHPILAFARNFHIKKQFQRTKLWLLLHKSWKRSTGKVAAVYNNQMELENNIKAHFDLLEQMWAVSYVRKQRQ